MTDRELVVFLQQQISELTASFTKTIEGLTQKVISLKSALLDLNNIILDII
jgi:hypothetical protein